MDVDHLRRCLDDLSISKSWLSDLGLGDLSRGHRNLVSIAHHGMTLDLLATLCDQLMQELPVLSDPDMALNNLERFVSVSRNRLALGSLFERDPEALSTLLQIFSTSQYLSDLLINDSGSYDLLRLTEGQPISRDHLLSELLSDVETLTDYRDVMSVLRRYKRREILRISYGDIVRGQSLETVTRQLSFLAETILESAVLFSRRKLEASRGIPRTADGQLVPFVVLGLGKLGGEELNYSSDIDLVCLYDGDGKTDNARGQSNQEFFERLVQEVVRLLSEPTTLGVLYRVDLRLRPSGAQGRVTLSVKDALHYYDVQGRTWERQAYVKARPVAGDRVLGHGFLRHLEPWIYRRYLSLADITGIKSLKRRIEQQAHSQGTNLRDTKTGLGGIRDIEFVIQFLQLLNGGGLPELHTGNTLEAIARLEKNGCLTYQERLLLEENYQFLRKIEHRLQIMFDLQTHLIPDDPIERRKVGIRMGYTNTTERTSLEEFDADYKHKTKINRKILDHLLHDAFGDDVATEPEVDLVNNPNPSDEQISDVLAAYGFRNLPSAYRNLMALATEKIRFLSTRRCRHFLASIAPHLLPAISETPDPDFTLLQLSQVSDSLGGKGALWESFRTNPPSLKLYVKLCATCPYLTGILKRNPGMIDELVDSLLLERLPTKEMLEKTLVELSRSAENIDPILHRFKNAQHLRVGVRDVLGKDDIVSTHVALAAIAEVCLKLIVTSEHEKLVKKYGRPIVGDGPLRGQECKLVILAQGKLGGREPNYHSDLDLVFLYEADGFTIHPRNTKQLDTTTNGHFFSELGQRIIKIASHLGPYGRLYELDARLRPTGKSGSLAVPFREFLRYFLSGSGHIWERLALCKGRIVYGSPKAAQQAMILVNQAIDATPWKCENAEEIRQMRYQLEEGASKRNLKRGTGGTVDVEFLVQMLQLRHGANEPSIRVPGTLHALTSLHEANLLKEDDYTYFSHAYRFQRSVEARIRLMNSAGRHELPEDEIELKKLSYLIGYTDSSALVAEAMDIFRNNRSRFERLFDAIAQPPAGGTSEDH